METQLASKDRMAPPGARGPRYLSQGRCSAPGPKEGHGHGSASTGTGRILAGICHGHPMAGGEAGSQRATDTGTSEREQSQGLPARWAEGKSDAFETHEGPFLTRAGPVQYIPNMRRHSSHLPKAICRFTNALTPVLSESTSPGLDPPVGTSVDS